MKKTPSLLLAVVSTMFLLLGSSRAAEKFDAIGHTAKVTSFSDTVMDGPSLPCLVGDEN